MPYQFRGKVYDDFEPGQEFTTASRTVTEGDISLFAGLSGDYNPLHTDEVFASATPFRGRIAHGMLVASIATGQANQLGIFEGTSIALLGMTLKFTGPVKAGDTVTTIIKVVEKKESSKPDKGVVEFDIRAVNQRGEAAMESRWTLLMKRRK